MERVTNVSVKRAPAPTGKDAATIISRLFPASSFTWLRRGPLPGGSGFARNGWSMFKLMVSGASSLSTIRNRAGGGASDRGKLKAPTCTSSPSPSSKLSSNTTNPNMVETALSPAGIVTGRRTDVACWGSSLRGITNCLEPTPHAPLLGLQLVVDPEMVNTSAPSNSASSVIRNSNLTALPEVPPSIFTSNCPPVTG